MHSVRIVAPVLAAASTALLLFPPPGEAFTHTTDVLGLAQRDFRVFDNFADPSANDNTVEHPSFPGWTGAELAIWKASVEWGSLLHGDGHGDPHQPGDLGSGGANFDAWFRGAAAAMGSTNDNIHAATLSLGGGVIAVTETPTSDGWRILYNDSFVWSDGPEASVPAGQIDIQAIATHEYGHALGLGHSTVPGATMSAVASGDGIHVRSIEADDKAGIQAKYGAAAPAKPRITSAIAAAGQLLISGSGFAPTGLEIWSTDAVVAGVTSISGGSYVAIALPPGTGSGDVLVRNPGTAASSLSNAYPLDTTPPCGAQAYGIELGGANVGSLSSASAPSPGGMLTLDVSGLGPSPLGLIALGPAPGTIGLFGGTILIDIALPLTMLPVPLAGGTGQLSLVVPSDPGLVGTEAFAQAGAPDPAQPAGIALTNGLVVRVCP